MDFKLHGVGVCVHLSRRNLGWKSEYLLPLAKEMGARFVREGVLWQDVEKEKGVYSIPQKYLDWLQSVTDAGMGINLILSYGNNIYENPMDPKAFSNYALYVAREVVGKYNIVSFEIFNEPYNFYYAQHYGGTWNGKEPCLWLEKYAELVSITAAALKKEVPQIPLIVGPGEPQFFRMAMRYPKSLEQIDGVAIHPYPSRFPPETVPWGGQQIFERDGVSVADDDHSLISMGIRLTECCEKYLGRKLSLHITEWGYPTYDHNLRGTHFAGYTEEAQALYILRGLILSAASKFDSICIYDFMDDGNDRYEAEDNFGLVRNEEKNYERKPSWYMVNRLFDWLTPDMKYISNPPAELKVQINPLPYNDDLWMLPVKESHLCISSEQVFWFKDENDIVCFIWRAGRINGEYRDPIGTLQWNNAPAYRQIDMVDLSTGKHLPVNASIENGNLTIPEVPVGASPVVIRWKL